MRRAHEPGANRSVALVGLAVASSLLGDVTIYTVLPIHYEALGLSALEVGIILSANRWVRLVTNQLPHRVLDRFGTRHVLALALIAGSVISLAYASAPPFWLFFLARIAWGAAWSFIRHAGVMGSMQAATGRNAGQTIGVYNGVVQLGYIAGTLAGAAVFDAFGFAWAFAAMAVISLVGVVFDYAGFRGLASRLPRVRRETGSARPREAGALVRSFVTSCVGVGLIVSTLGFALRERFGETIAIGPLVIGIASVNGVLIAVRYGIDGVGSPLIGAAVDRIGRRTSELVAFSVGTIALAASALFAASPVLVPLIVFFFVVNVAARLSLISRAGLAGAASFSRLMTASDIGSASGPLIGWIAIDRAGSPDAVFAIGAALYAVATVSAFAARRGRE